MTKKILAPRNRTIILDENEKTNYIKNLLKLSDNISAKQITDRVINQNFFDAINFLPNSFIDLLIIDPPYNLDKTFNKTQFKQMPIEQYSEWVNDFISGIKRCLTPNASIYFCSDWKSSYAAYEVLSKHFKIQNRITWEREKGRGAKRNWKNNHEDIWFATVSDDFTFNTDAVKLKRRVLAPYKDIKGNAKDWNSSKEGKFRLTHPSNLWTDISIPFWSMPENTEHPTQKPEKLIAKIILASSNEGDFVFDPFMGSGTTCVTAKKLNRKFCGIELDTKYAVLGLKRLDIAEEDNTIQGYFDGTFWERNTYSLIKKQKKI